MSEAVLLAIIGGVVTVLVAYMEKMRRDVKTVKSDAASAKQAATATEASINNRPAPLSDRLDAVHNSVNMIGERLESHSRDLRGFRQDIGELRGEDRDIRKQLQEHIQQSGHMMPMLTDLHERWSGKDLTGSS